MFKMHRRDHQFHSDVRRRDLHQTSNLVCGRGHTHLKYRQIVVIGIVSSAHILAATGSRILNSERNYKKGLGLPLSVLQMASRGHNPDDYDLEVLEMGMSSPTHEIRRLVQITPPDIGVELMIAPVHLEHLGTIENV